MVREPSEGFPSNSEEAFPLGQVLPSHPQREAADEQLFEVDVGVLEGNLVEAVRRAWDHDLIGLLDQPGVDVDVLAQGRPGPEPRAIADLVALVLGRAVEVEHVVPVLVADTLLETELEAAGILALRRGEGCGGGGENEHEGGEEVSGSQGWLFSSALANPGSERTTVSRETVRDSRMYPPRPKPVPGTASTPSDCSSRTKAMSSGTGVFRKR